MCPCSKQTSQMVLSDSCFKYHTSSFKHETLAQGADKYTKSIARTQQHSITAWLEMIVLSPEESKYLYTSYLKKVSKSFSIVLWMKLAKLFFLCYLEWCGRTVFKANGSKCAIVLLFLLKLLLCVLWDVYV